MTGIYVHIPFCEHKCMYCDFYVVERLARYREFIDALGLEIRLRADGIQTRERFDSVYFGGGTPSLLHPDDLHLIMNTLRDVFPINDNAEATLECNPEDAVPDKLHAFREAGMNRLSLGIQSFHDDELRFLTRNHSKAGAIEAIESARAAGFSNVNIDLIFSLPGQSRERWIENLRKAITLGVDHVSCYALTVERGTPLFNMVQQGKVHPMDLDEDAILYESTIGMLEDAGFNHYEVSNFARPGFECMHNRVYWQQNDYLGFGPSAHGTWMNDRSWNVRSLSTYIDALGKNALPIAGGEVITKELRREEYVFLHLRSGGIDLNDYRERFDETFSDARMQALRKFLDEGFIAMNDERISLTRKGFAVCDGICAALM